MAEQEKESTNAEKAAPKCQNRMCLGGRFTLGEIGAVKLKKTKQTEAQKKKEETKFAKQLCENSDDYYRLVKETYFENYFEKIKDLTFATDYIELSKDDCTELMRLHKDYLKTCESADEKSADEVAVSYEADLSKLGHLVTAIDKTLKSNQWKHGFVRMSIRSPKDAALTSKKFKTIFDRELASLQKLQGSEPPEDFKVTGGDRNEVWTLNQKIIACYRAQTFALAIESGVEAVNLLVRSPRIQGDMESFLDGTYQQKFQLCIRHFQFFDVSYEFRSFVYKGKLTGLTQYNDLCLFPDLIKFKAKIEKKFESFIAECVKRLEMENLVLDLVLVDTKYDGKSEWPQLSDAMLDNLKIMIIEVNPLAEFAGGGMFEWNKDKKVLLGETPFEFRIQTKLSKYISADLMPEWQPFIFGKDAKIIK